MSSHRFRFRAAEGVVHPDSAPCSHLRGRRGLRKIIFRATYENSGIRHRRIRMSEIGPEGLFQKELGRNVVPCVCRRSSAIDAEAFGEPWPFPFHPRAKLSKRWRWCNKPRHKKRPPMAQAIGGQMVEARGVEPLSETPSTLASTRLA